jgi:hypothetical protein
MNTASKLGPPTQTGSAYDSFEIIEARSLLERWKLAAEKFDARQWWSFFKGLGSLSGCGLCLKLLLCV